MNCYCRLPVFTRDMEMGVKIHCHDLEVGLFIEILYEFDLSSIILCLSNSTIRTQVRKTNIRNTVCSIFGPNSEMNADVQ